MPLDLIKDLPIPKSLGVPTDCALLAGMGYGRAYQVETDNGLLVLKGSHEKRERLFYENIAPIVNGAGVSTPELLWSYQGNQSSWVALEWIPEILPESRWQVDDEVFNKLALLHNLTVNLNGISPEKMQWTAEMNHLALTVSRGAYAVSDQSRLEDLRDKFQYLFEPKYFLSGDPSGRNWGLRENGQLVLFDWERFGFGMPQLDLACVAFGEPPTEVFREIAKGYLKHNPIESSLEKFTTEIQVARIHCCISMLSSHSRGLAHLPQRIVDLTISGLGDLVKRIDL